MKFITPNILELNDLDKKILEGIDSREVFGFCNCAARVEKFEQMINWKTIGEEYPLKPLTESEGV